MKKNCRVYMIVMMAVLMCILLSASAAAQSSRCSYYQEHGEHDWMRIEISTTSCTTDGYAILKCNSCSAAQKEEGEKAWGHDWQQTEVVAAGCETDGYRNIVCGNCGVSKKERTEKAFGHSWQQTNVVQPACTEKGSIEYVCSICNENRRESQKALGHRWEKDAEVEPTCTQDGYISFHCANTDTGCTETKETALRAVGHNPKDVRTLKVSTCLETGFVQTRCIACGATDVRETELAEHNYGMWSISKAATDCEMGVSERSCIVCRNTEQKEFYPDGTMYRGIEVGENVRQLQTMLVQCGYLSAGVDGEFGKKTEQAVRNFQAQAGVREDGIAWPQTVNLLTEAWERKMGIAQNPTSVPSSTAAPEVAEQHCIHKVNEQGVSEIIYCQIHQKMLDDDALVLDGAASAEEQLALLKQIRTRWEAEMAWMYEEWLDRVPETDKGMVTNANAAFSIYIASQELIWSRQYAQMPEAVIEKVNSLLIMQTVDLCSIIYNISGNALVSTSNGYASIELVDGWYTGAVKGSASLVLYNDVLNSGGTSRLTITDDPMSNALENEKQSVLHFFSGKQFVDVLIGENVFSYVCSDDSMNFVLIAETSTGNVMKVESANCTIAQAMPLLKTMVIR